MSTPARRHRFTVDDFLRLADAGILEPEARVELLDGEIYAMPPIGPDHSGALHFLNRAWFVRMRPVDDFYRSRLPRPSDVLLAIEVAHESLAYDRAKLGRYAAADVVEGWLVNLADGAIEVHRSPVAGGDRDVRVVRRGERVACLAFPDAIFTADEILG